MQYTEEELKQYARNLKQAKRLLLRFEDAIKENNRDITQALFACSAIPGILYGSN